MIAQAKSFADNGDSVSYAMEKEKAEVIHKQHIFGDTVKEVNQELTAFHTLNSRCKNKMMSFVLSPHPDDKLHNDKLKKIATDFLKKMGLSEHQSIITKHLDSKSGIPHLHIYTNRIDYTGKAYDTNFIGLVAIRKADEVAQEHNLTRAKEIKEKKDLEKRPTKEQIQKTFLEALQHTNNQSEFFAYLEKKGITKEDSIDKKGKLRGYRVSLGSEDFKASEIGRNYTLNKLEATILKTPTKGEKEKRVQGIKVSPKPDSLIVPEKTKTKVKTSRAITGRKRKRDIEPDFEL